MRRACILSLAALAIAALSAPALAGRTLTDEERTKVGAALASEGCSGGKKMEFDDGKFEVDDAKCQDGKLYDIDLDKSFKVIRKELED